MDPVQRDALDRFFVQTFNNILAWEELSITSMDCKNLSMKELHAIEAVAQLQQSGQNTMTQIANRLFISVGALTTAVNVLVNKGYLERQNSPKDRRIVQIFLTKKGERAAAFHQRFHAEMIESIGDCLNESQLDSLITSLDLLSAFFEGKRKNPGLRLPKFSTQGDSKTMAIRIITDSTADFTVEQAKAMNVELIPLKVNFGTEEYVDKFTITNEQFYEKLKTSSEIPTTAAPSPQDFTEFFKKYPDDDIIGMFISKNLSATYQSAVMAKEELNRDNIYLIDSGSATIGCALLVNQAVKLRDQGIPAADIAARLNELVPKIGLFIAFDTLKYLVKGGRLPAAAGMLGGMMGIRPVAKVTDGVLSIEGKERGMKKASDFLLKYIEEKCDRDPDMPVMFGHSNNPEDLDYLSRDFGTGYQALTFGSVIGTHAGPGAIGIAFFNK